MAACCVVRPHKQVDALRRLFLAGSKPTTPSLRLQHVAKPRLPDVAVQRLALSDLDPTLGQVNELHVRVLAGLDAITPPPRFITSTNVITPDVVHKSELGNHGGFVDDARDIIDVPVPSRSAQQILADTHGGSACSPTPDSPPSCKACESSEHNFSIPSQTIIIFDWDDTLLPSFEILKKHKLKLGSQPPDDNLAQRLDDIAREVESLLERAHELAMGLVIVTNGQDGWVEASCKAWMPRLSKALESIPIYSARSVWEPQGIRSPTGWKTREFESRISEFYSGQSWKNVVAIGDSRFEHDALRRVVRDSVWKSPEMCRSKSVKFVPQPRMDELKFELQTLREILSDVVSHNGNLERVIPRSSACESSIVADV